MKRTDQPTLIFFNDNPKSSANENIDAGRMPLAIRNEIQQAIEGRLGKFKDEIICAFEEKFGDNKNERVATKQKVRRQKRNARVVYVADDVWPIFERFQEKLGEPIKETLRNMVKAAEKYLELKGNLRKHEPDQQNILQKTRNLR